MSSVRIDPFFYKQPPLLFIDELRTPIHTRKPDWFGRTALCEGEVPAKGVYIDNQFPDEEKLLETVVADLNLFFQVHEIAGNRYPIRLVKQETECFEAYRIVVDEECCTIEAEDTEGIRRGLIYVEDEMLRREGAILPVGEIARKPVIKARITRGFFSPTNRPPKNQDELMDDVDYYPDEYLNRLAHDGTNGIWIYCHFKELLTSDYFPEYGKDFAKRIAKLRRVVDKCKRYGVKVYVFGVEPSGMVPELAKYHEEALGGTALNDWRFICTSTEIGQNYSIEMTQRLMEQVPDLGGIIDITCGERPTTCVSLPPACECPRCKSQDKGKILARNVDLFKEGMRRAGSKAEFVSWTYGHKVWEMDEIKDYVRNAPSDVALMQNFEELGYAEQLGKIRQARDYWLSYVGPSQMFIEAAETAVAEGKRNYAKMQVCCSHELATVPYIPVPGILFEKYAGAYKYKVEGVMQCWYFGNYPSLMSKAAGELSFMDEFTDKEQFLMHLAGIYYGAKAAEAVEAWKYFEDGYKNYPINVMFGYYGPMHDGVVWDLALLPRDYALSRSWRLMDKPDGDRIGECLQSGHTLSEAVELTGYIQKDWQKGMEVLPENGPKEQRYVAEALHILFASGHNILRFYELRRMLGEGSDRPWEVLKEMEAIVDLEIENSQKMIPLCREDLRLGYHSEAEGFKFFPEKLEDRIGKLEKLKAEEFAEVRKNLAEGKAPLSWYLGQEGPSYRLIKGAVEKASFTPVGEKCKFRASFDEDNLYVELEGSSDIKYKLYFEYELMWPAPGIEIENEAIRLTNPSVTHQSVFGEKIKQELDKYQIMRTDMNGERILLTISREKAGWTKDRPLRARIEADGVSWIEEDEPCHTLGKADTSPGEFGWFLPE